VEVKRVIITGPTGAVGMALIQYLIDLGVQVVAVVREGSERENRIIENDNLVKVWCSLAELSVLPSKVFEALDRKGWKKSDGFDVFYHLAWDGTFGNTRNNMQGQLNNVQYTLDAVESAAVMGCHTFIGAGSQAEYGRCEGRLCDKTPTFPENGYGIAKLCAGQMSRILCEQKGMRHIWARILSVYGPYDGENTMIMSAIRTLLNGERVSLTKGEQQWDYLYSMDAAKSMYLLGEKGINGKTYCIGSGIANRISDYVKILADNISQNAEIGFGDVPYSEKQVMYLCADISELRRDTGFEPRISFQEGIKKTIEWAKEYYKLNEI
jgi:nucleoside-diphosphate-sugar epimerase